uniref:Uncharacterized protein n=1 Tax=Rhizophora mucronata TaxID=61149 RepID=A0A2P2N6G6_RHIMU
MISQTHGQQFCNTEM